MLLSSEELERHAPGRPAALTVGVFDGVHLGHRHLVEELKARAAQRGLASGVVTLHPSPIQVLRPEVRIAYLTSLEERVELLRTPASMPSRRSRSRRRSPSCRRPTSCGCCTTRSTCATC